MILFILGFYTGGLVFAFSLFVSAERSNRYKATSCFKLVVSCVSWPVMAVQCLFEEKKQ